MSENSDYGPYPTFQDKCIKLPKSEITGFFIICHTQNISERWNYISTVTRVYRVQEWDQLKEKKGGKSQSSEGRWGKIYTCPRILNKLKTQERKGKGYSIEKNMHLSARKNTEENIILKSKHVATFSLPLNFMYHKAQTTRITKATRVLFCTCSSLNAIF